MSIFARNTRWPFSNSPRAHALEQVEVLGDAAVAVRAAAGLGQRAPQRGDLLGREIAT